MGPFEPVVDQGLASLSGPANISKRRSESAPWLFTMVIGIDHVAARLDIFLAIVA
jgi:hypothetical protein